MQTLSKGMEAGSSSTTLRVNLAHRLTLNPSYNKSVDLLKPKYKVKLTNKYVLFK